MRGKRRLAILLFDDAEVLDFAGPFEVFSTTKDEYGNSLFEVLLIAEKEDSISARNNFKVIPHMCLSAIPRLDILLIPGGWGTRQEMHNEALLKWVNRQYEELELLLSVCTGSLILGACGLLDGLQATTHHGAYDELLQVAPETRLIRDQKYVDNGKVITAAGISAGIEMSLHVVRRLHGRSTAQRTADYMEYSWRA